MRKAKTIQMDICESEEKIKFSYSKTGTTAEKAKLRVYRLELEDLEAEESAERMCYE